MRGDTNKKRYIFLYILSMILMIFLFVFVIYMETCDRKNNFKILVGAVYDKNPEVADTVLGEAFKLKENTKLEVNDVTGKKLIEQADKAAYSLGYTDKAYDILFDTYLGGMKKYELTGCSVFILLTAFLSLSIYFEKKNIIIYFKNISGRISVALNEKTKFKKSDGGLFYFLENDIENLINVQRNLNHYINKKEEDMQKFMENIAHQIKTPLARILLNLDMLSSFFEDYCFENKVEYFDKTSENYNIYDKTSCENNYKKQEITGEIIIKAEQNKINKLISDSLNSGEEIKRHIMMLLNLARMKAGKVHFRKDIVDLASIFEKIVERFGRENIDIDINEIDEIYIRGDEDWLFEAVSNIVDNSLVHGNPQKPIEITVREFETDVRVCITDFGKGVSDEEISKIFDRYYTGDGSDAYSTGIRMNLARYVIKAHYSDIRLSSNWKTGLKIEFNLPKPELKNKIFAD